MPYENFPYADLHNLNLDWLLKQVKEDHEKLEGTDFGELIDESVQEAIDDGRIGDLINQTLLDDINDDIHDLNSDVAGLTSRVGVLEGKVSTHTGQIENLFGQLATATVAMLGCPAVSTLDSSRGYSLCVVIHNDDFCVVYDMGNDNAATLITYLTNQGVEKIDAMIISHYHNDHVQTAGVNALLNSGIPVTRWYLPHGLIDWNSYTGTGYESIANTIKGLITGAGSAWTEPTENQSIMLGGLPWNTVQFFNLSPAYFAGYYSYMRDEDNDPITSTNYNNFSMCCRVRVGGKLLVLTGDIEQPAQANMTKIIGGADIVQIPHHGLDLIDDEGFRTAMSGKIFLTAAYGLARFKRLQIAANLMLQRARQLGSSVSTVGDTTILCQFGGMGCYLVPDYMGTVTPSAGFGDNIPSGADLDDYTTVGFIGFVKNATAAGNISNVPESSAGVLEVLATNQNTNDDSTGSIRQVYTLLFSYAHPKIYVRWKYEGSWTAWKGYDAT